MRVPQVLLICLLGAGCASAGPPEPPARHGRGGGQARPAAAALFISPMGQPFRSRPGQPYPVAQWFGGADANHDGRLDRAEFRADAAAWFAVLDANGDGTIDSFENDAYERSIPELSGGAGLSFDGGERGGMRRPRPGDAPNLGERGGRRGASRQGGGGGGEGGGNDLRAALQGAAPYGLLGDPQPVRSADADQSQSVSRKEFLAAADHRFDRLDKNADGFIALDELPQTAVQSRKAKR